MPLTLFHDLGCRGHKLRLQPAEEKKEQAVPNATWASWAGSAVSAVSAKAGLFVIVRLQQNHFGIDILC